MTEKLTPAQNKTAHLLRDVGMPPEWAVLLVQRANTTGLQYLNVYAKRENLSELVLGAFYWDESPEGNEFWSSVEYAFADEVAQ